MCSLFQRYHIHSVWPNLSEIPHICVLEIDLIDQPIRMWSVSTDLLSRNISKRGGGGYSQRSPVHVGSRKGWIFSAKDHQVPAFLEVIDSFTSDWVSDNFFYPKAEYWGNKTGNSVIKLVHLIPEFYINHKILSIF